MPNPRAQARVSRREISDRERGCAVTRRLQRLVGQLVIFRQQVHLLSALPCMNRASDEPCFCSPRIDMLYARRSEEPVSPLSHDVGTHSFYECTLVLKGFPGYNGFC